MDGEYFHNPLAYDEQAVAEKLGIYDYSPKPENDVNINLKLALMQEELSNSKKQVAQLQKNKFNSKRETFVSGGCNCGASEGFKSKSISDMEESMFDNKKILTFLVVILAAFCVIQYISYHNENRELMNIMYMLLKHQEQSAAPAPQKTAV